MAARSNQLAISTVGAAGGGDSLALHRSRLEYRLVLLFIVQVPGPHSTDKNKSHKTQSQNMEITAHVQWNIVNLWREKKKRKRHLKMLV